MSSEMRKYVAALRDREHRFHGMGGHYVAEVIRGELEDILARTEAGADGAVAWVTEVDAKAFGKGQGESAFLFEKHGKWNVPLYIHPQDASGDAEMTGHGDHDDLPAFLEWVAGEVVRRDTRAGNFAEGLAQSLRGRAHILRIVKNDAMQAKEAK